MSWVMDYMRQLNQMIYAQRLAMTEYNNARMLRNNQILMMNNYLRTISTSTSYNPGSNPGSYTGGG